VSIVVGWWRLCRRRPDVLLWTAPFYIALNVLWSADQGGRYTLPMLPVMAAALWSAATSMGPAMRRFAMPFVAAHAIVALGYWLGVDLPRTRETNAHWPALDALVARIDTDRDRVAVLKMPPEDANLLGFSLGLRLLAWCAERPK